ncbi:hypothetical protein BG011_005258 [Mortierella polycephala]|uniref:Protein kinase domain-containing protein n=1 Tax=Mortierella polycephala TaxID=41804 RepID=A0A9P6QFP4_9FUNG|nr:hypothetical protein BG011_005258 [Mortierella polycephala]
MARPQSTIPKLGYPCMAASDDTISLVGLQHAAPTPDVANSTSYILQSYTMPNDKNLSNSSTVTFTPTPHAKPFNVKALTTSRMFCTVDNTSDTFLYIFNENVYIENANNPALATTEPLAKWDAARGLMPQVVYPKDGAQGQFQWLGLNGGNWTLIDIDAASGISDPVPAPVPAAIPSTGIFSVIREFGGSFLVIYNNASETQAARFRLGESSTTVVRLATPDIGYIGFSSIAHAQDTTNDYFFGSDVKGQNLTFTAVANLSNSLIDKLSTRPFPSDNLGRVPQLYSYGAAAIIDKAKALVYGGQSDMKTNSWNFGMTTVNTDAGRLYNTYSIFPVDEATDSGAFTVLAPPPASPQDQDSKGLSTPAIIGIVVGAIALIMLIALFVIFHRRNKQIKERTREQQGLNMAVRDLHSKGGEGMGSYQPRFASTHSLLDSEANTTSRGHASVLTERPVENLTLRVPIVRYNGHDVAQSVPHAPLGAVVLSQYRLGQTAVNTNMVVIQLGENVDTAESVTLKWVRDEIVWQREAAMLNHIVNPAKIISLHQTMIIPAALEWRHILVLDAHESTLDFMLSTHEHRVLGRPDQIAVSKALLSGLVWCHEKDVVHLSICTGSLVLNEEGQWVIWSFGGARFLNEAVGPRQGLLIGQENGAVERNLAPELLNARREKTLDTTLSTTAMDAWAAGCVLFEVLTGQPLFRTEDAADQAGTGRFNAWKDRLADIKDPKERRVVEGLLVLDPNYRMTLGQAESLFV